MTSRYPDRVTLRTCGGSPLPPAQLRHLGTMAVCSRSATAKGHIKLSSVDREPQQSVLNRYDQFVRMRHVQVAAQEFPDKIGIGLLRIEQRDTIFELVTLSLKPRYFGFALPQQPGILAPGQQSAWSCNADCAKHEQRNQRKRLGQAVFR